MHKEVISLHGQVKLKEQESEQRRQEAVKISQNVERLKIEFLKQMQAEQEKMRKEIEALKQKHAEEEKSIKDRSETILRAAQKEFETANNAMIERIKDLEYKLVTRESRPEDREKIVQLEKEVAEKEYLCKRIMEEMKYFKRVLGNQRCSETNESTTARSEQEIGVMGNSKREINALFKLIVDVKRKHGVE
eukprot:749816-Hanusia_phi.AAC.4